MEKEFILYKEASALKELGFDELVIAKYQKLSESASYQLQLLQRERNCNRLDAAISAPLYQQVFRWFRINKKLEYHVKSDMMGYYTYIVDRNIHKTIPMGSNIFKTYEEAELACLIKLIESCKKV